MLNELMLRLLNPLTDNLLKTMLTEAYSHTPFVMTTTFEKLSLRAVIEAGIRAQTGKALSRPMGSPLCLSPWEQLLLYSRQLFRKRTGSHRPNRKVDFIVIDGQEEGTAAAAPTLEDDMGFPTLFGLVRTK